MKQSPLDFVRSHSSARRHDTEVESACVAADNLSRGCSRVLRMLDVASERGLTDIEGQEMYHSFPKRRCDLYQRGLVFDSGRRRLTPRGARAIVWVSRRDWVSHPD